MTTLARTFAIFAGFAVLTAAGIASAQYSPYHAPHTGVPYVGSNWGGIQHHSSTYEEGVQRGYADIIRSQGLRDLLQSQAAVNIEHARALYLENKVARVKTFYERRQIARDAAQQKKLAREARVAKYAAIKAARRNRPVVVDQINTVTGEIQWPEVLQDRRFDASRRKLDRLMAERMSGLQGTAGESLRDIRQAATDLSVELKREFRTLPAGQYTVGRKFIVNLVEQAGAIGSTPAGRIAAAR